MSKYSIVNGMVEYTVLGRNLRCPQFLVADGQQWLLYSWGNFNLTYRAQNRGEILKVQHPLGKGGYPTDQSTRAIAVWHELNPGLPARSCSVYGANDAWIVPFIEGRRASDQAIQHKIIDIFNVHRRVVVDAYSPGNFITKLSGETICVDVGLAIQFPRSHGGRASPASALVWRGSESKDLMPQKIVTLGYMAKMRKAKDLQSKYVDTVAALLLLAEYMPEVADASFLLTNPDGAKKMAKAYVAISKYDLDAKLEKRDELLLPLKQEVQTMVSQYNTKKVVQNVLAPYSRSKQPMTVGYTDNWRKREQQKNVGAAVKKKAKAFQAVADAAADAVKLPPIRRQALNPRNDLQTRPRWR